MAQQFVEMDWIGNDEFNTFIDEVGTLPTKREEAIKEVTEDDTNNDESDLANLRVEVEHFDLDEYKSTLTKSQRRAYTEISDTLTSGKQLLAAVIGEAGTGKSYLLKGIVENAQNMIHLSARKLATTGAAAHLIGGETLHHFFGMDIYCNTRIEPGTIEYERINRTGIIIIDELPYTTTV